MTQPQTSKPVLYALVTWLLLLWVITAINPHDRSDWLLENMLVFISVLLLAGTYRWFQFTTVSYVLFASFLSLHLIGAHYTYSETPLGFWLQDGLGWERNHYDRIVHFSFGLLLAFPLREELLRQPKVKRSWSYGLAIALVLALSAVYEVLEGAAALLVSPDLGAAFLGAQGDQWDSQKDTFLAFAGSIVAMLITFCWIKTKGPIIR